VRPISVSFAAVEGLRESELSNHQGIYIFYSSSETLYVGEGGNLRNRIAKHLDHSDNKNLARWFWSHGFRDVHLEMQVLDANTSTKVRRALEAELISTRRPIFNVQRLEVS
jgi:excinuclease UvrABC nuclease subunit